jgi:hypothetical protein
MVERFQLVADGHPAIGSGHEKYVKAGFRRQDYPLQQLRRLSWPLGRTAAGLRKADSERRKHRSQHGTMTKNA